MRRLPPRLPCPSASISISRVARRRRKAVFEGPQQANFHRYLSKAQERLRVGVIWRIWPSEEYKIAHDRPGLLSLSDICARPSQMQGSLAKKMIRASRGLT